MNIVKFVSLAERADQWLPGQKALASAVVSFRVDATTMFRAMSLDLANMLAKYTPNLTQDIPKTALRMILAEAGDIVAKYFVGKDGRHPYGTDGVTPLAYYPRILNKRLGQVLVAVTNESGRYMRDHLPSDLSRWYMYGRYTPPPTKSERVKQPKRIVDRDPFAQYDAPHFWVDPRGYRLSDRIWEVSNTTRTLIDQILSTAINGGIGSYNLSRVLEASLIPGRDIRSYRPYAKNVSYLAMRLARTEISHAHNQATLVAARANPYVDGIDWSLSASHPKSDVCDNLATIGMSGQRLKDPYPVYAAEVPPAHPQCICNSRQVVTKTPDDMVAELRAELNDSANENIRPYINPLQYETFLRELMGGFTFGDNPYGN